MKFYLMWKSACAVLLLFRINEVFMDQFKVKTKCSLVQFSVFRPNLNLIFAVDIFSATFECILVNSANCCWCLYFSIVNLNTWTLNRDGSKSIFNLTFHENHKSNERLKWDKNTRANKEKIDCLCPYHVKRWTISGLFEMNYILI